MNNNIRIFIATFFLVIMQCMILNGQLLTTFKLYDNESAENGLDNVFDAVINNNIVYSVGYAEVLDDSNDESGSLWVMKTDLNGNILKRAFYIDEGLYPTKIDQIHDNNFVLGGYYYGIGGFIIVMDSDLNTITSATFDYPIVSFYVDGNNIIVSTGSRIIKFDSNLKVIQTSNFDTGLAFVSKSLNGGTIVLTSALNAPDEWNLPQQLYGQGDIVVFELDEEFNIIWSKNYGGSKYDDVFMDERLGREAAIISLPESNTYLFTAYTYSNDYDVKQNHGTNDIWLVKIDGNGSIIWEKTVGGVGIDLPTNITESNGLYYLSAYSVNLKSTPTSYICETCRPWTAYTMILDSDGNTLLHFWLDGNEDELFTSIQIYNNKIYCFGWSESYNGDFINVADDGDAFLAIYNNPLTGLQVSDDNNKNVALSCHDQKLHFIPPHLTEYNLSIVDNLGRVFDIPGTKVGHISEDVSFLGSGLYFLRIKFEQIPKVYTYPFFYGE